MPGGMWCSRESGEDSWISREDVGRAIETEMFCGVPGVSGVVGAGDVVRKSLGDGVVTAGFSAVAGGLDGVVASFRIFDAGCKVSESSSSRERFFTADKFTTLRVEPTNLHVTIPFLCTH